MAKPTDFTPQNNVAAGPTGINAKAWLRKQLIRVVAHTILALYWISIGCYIELKYHWLGTPAVLSTMHSKGGK